MNNNTVLSFLLVVFTHKENLEFVLLDSCMFFVTSILVCSGSKIVSHDLDHKKKLILYFQLMNLHRNILNPLLMLFTE